MSAWLLLPLLLSQPLAFGLKLFLPLTLLVQVLLGRASRRLAWLRPLGGRRLLLLPQALPFGLELLLTLELQIRVRLSGAGRGLRRTSLWLLRSLGGAGLRPLRSLRRTRSLRGTLGRRLLLTLFAALLLALSLRLRLLLLGRLRLCWRCAQQGDRRQCDGIFHSAAPVGP